MCLGKIGCDGIVVMDDGMSTRIVFVWLTHNRHPGTKLD